ncbi:MAG: RDD family protein [Vicinamibacteria bacterium]
MSCTNHPAVVDNIQMCERCSKPFCRNCLIVFQGKKLCGDCKNQRIRAVQSGAPEGTLQLATIGRRWGALWIDTFVIMIPLFFVLVVFIFAAGRAGINPGATGNLMNIGFYVVFIAYEALMVSSSGQTLGKKWLGIKVVNPDGSDVSASQAWGRAAGKVLINLCFGIGYLLAIGDKEKKTLHDRLAKTRVIRL